MQLDPQAIAEFKQLYLKEYGIELSDIEALELGTRLVRFVKSVYGNDLPKLNKVDKQEEKNDN